MPDPVVVEPPPAESNPVVSPETAAPNIDVRVPGLLERLLDTVEDTPRKPEKKEEAPPVAPAPKDKPAEKPNAEAKPGDAAKPEGQPEQPIRLRKQKINRPELPIEAPKPVVAPPPVEDKPDPQWEAGLDETQKEILADARDAEKQFPDRHKGLAARTAKFLRDDAAKRAADDFDDQSPEYRTWLERSQPKLSRQEIRELEETRVASRVEKQWKGKYDDLQHKLFVQKAEPQIENEGRQIFAQLSQTALPDEITAAIKKDGFDKASEHYRLELETAQEVLTTVADDLKEFKKLSTKDPETGRPMATEVTDPRDPKFVQHQRLGVMVTNVCESFKNTAPAEKQLRDGKWFVTRDEWMSIRPDQRHRFWTFNNAELATMAQGAVKAVVAAKINEKRAHISRYGWQPPQPKPAQNVTPPKPAAPPVPTSQPRTPAPSAVPGNSETIAEIDARTTGLASRLARAE